jgi:uncharacterized protein YnzC (UPF0291/DUF896 family)
MEEIKIERINELSKKSKEIGLTEEEKTEQKALRIEFLKDIKGQLNSQLSRVKFVDENGQIVGDLNDAKNHKHTNCDCHEHNHDHNHKN